MFINYRDRSIFFTINKPDNSLHINSKSFISFSKKFCEVSFNYNAFISLEVTEEIEKNFETIRLHLEINGTKIRIFLTNVNPLIESEHIKSFEAMTLNKGQKIMFLTKDVVRNFKVLKRIKDVFER